MLTCSVGTLEPNWGNLEHELEMLVMVEEDNRQPGAYADVGISPYVSLVGVNKVSTVYCPGGCAS